MFSVSITHNLKIRELSDENKVKIRELSDGNKVIFCQTTFLSQVPPFLSYELWKLRIELRKQLNQTPPQSLYSIHSQSATNKVIFIYNFTVNLCDVCSMCFLCYYSFLFNSNFCIQLLSYLCWIPNNIITNISNSKQQSHIKYKYLRGNPFLFEGKNHGTNYE